MAAAAAMLEAPAGRVGKKDLAALLKWSRPALDRRLEQDPLFPVLSRGTRQGGWAFDVASVLNYLNGGGAAAAPSPAAPEADQDEPEAAPSAAVVPFRPGRAQHAGEATARNRKDLADAELKEDRLRRQRGELVEASDVREVLQTLLVELRTSLLNMPEAVAREFELPERVGLAMKGRVEALMRSAAMKAKQRLGEAGLAPESRPGMDPQADGV